MRIFDDYPLIIICGLSGIIFIIVGVILRVAPPKEMNHWYGYRTARSRKNQKHWTFAQSYAGKCFSIIGLFICLSSLEPAVYYFSPQIQTIVALAIILASCVLSIVLTENRLKKL